MRAHIAGLVITVAAFTITGCSTSATPTGPFNPCTEISDRALQDAHFDPKSKQTTASPNGHAVRCTLSGAGGTLMLEHPNASAPAGFTYDYALAAAKSRGATPAITKINNRDAYTGPQDFLGCATNLRTATSVLTIMVNDHTTDACAAAQSAAAALEPSIGDR
ncbi:hypothetical protein [Nocardia inohanensis]|uniref:hypothetical protein n=1 Tax=Nocardia inohanensis TaxID=209246 RepID=UPI00082C9276|nr:hypothetical protein [Nocardia inohanensis]